MKVGVLYSCFGETKTLHEWAQDLRCLVNEPALRNRVERSGWTVFQALTTPVQKQSALRRAAEGRT